MEDKKALKPRALLRLLSHLLQHQIDDLFAYGIMTSGVIISSIFFTCTYIAIEIYIRKVINKLFRNFTAN